MFLFLKLTLDQQLGLVDGTITDDSDAFLFGSRRVYKDFFNNGFYALEFKMDDIESKLGLDQERLIMLSLLLGCDYTDGVKGVGIVNSMEIVGAYKSFDSFLRFKEWADKPDFWNDPDHYEKAKGNLQIRFIYAFFSHILLTSMLNFYDFFDHF